MRWPGSVLLLLLLVTSVVAVQYRWQAAVSLPGPAVQTTSTVSRFACALRCETLPPESCSGFTYDAGDGTCRLFSGDCRGPAADSSQQTTDRYMARHQCPGSISSRCGCPAGFSRCAGRCLAWLDQTVNYTQAEALCAELGAHLAVPRSQAENQCAMTAAVDTGKAVWLGVNDIVTEDEFVGVDGCGVIPAAGQPWTQGQPNNFGDQDYVVMELSESTPPQGWGDLGPQRNMYPFCQLSLCYQSGCH